VVNNGVVATCVTRWICENGCHTRIRMRSAGRFGRFGWVVNIDMLLWKVVVFISNSDTQRIRFTRLGHPRPRLKGGGFMSTNLHMIVDVPTDIPCYLLTLYDSVFALYPIIILSRSNFVM
jgi:hypothetical protein